MINVLVADDDALVRLGLVDLLSTDAELNVVAEAPDGQAAVEQAGLHRVDIALVDVRMPRMDGITATRAARAPRPTTSDHPDHLRPRRVRLRRARRRADGFLLKDTAPRDIIRAVHVVAATRASCIRPPPVA
ncbi:response regulator transcription factor [Streptomyces kaempferi]